MAEFKNIDVAALQAMLAEGNIRLVDVRTDAEIAQAQYTVNNQPGVMFLLNFPTGQVAEDYFDTFGNGQFPADAGNRTYAKRAGPIVAILKGAMDAASADKLLGDLHYSYSIRWIYEKRNKPTILWGIPVKILGTVVRSLFFIAILGVFSIIAGAGFAILRFVFRGRFSKNTLLISCVYKKSIRMKKILYVFYRFSILIFVSLENNLNKY